MQIHRSNEKEEGTLTKKGIEKSTGRWESSEVVEGVLAPQRIGKGMGRAGASQIWIKMGQRCDEGGRWGVIGEKNSRLNERVIAPLDS